MMLAVWVSLAASAGAVARYLMDRFVQARHRTGLPFGTFFINLIGTFVLGLVTAVVTGHHMGASLGTVIGVGLCGGFTTWSTFCWETVALFESGAGAGAVLNVAGSLTLGAGAAALGLALGSL
jgi:CrcB protein